MQITPHKVLVEGLYGAFIIFWFLISYALSYQGINLLLSPLIDSIETVSFLVFLPHGIRIIAVYFLGWKAVLPLFIAHLVSYQLFDQMPPYWAQIPLAFVGALSAFIAFEMMRVCDLNSYYRVKASAERPNTIGPPMLAGILAAILNGLLTLAILMTANDADANLSLLLGYFVGDLLGVGVLLGFVFTLRRLVVSLGEAQNRY